MAKAFYLPYGPAKGRREAIMQVKEYDTKHGVRKVDENTIYLCHNRVRVRKLFGSIKAALEDLQTYGQLVLLPNGETVRPPVYNGYEDDKE